MSRSEANGVALIARGLKKGFKVGRGRTEVLKDVDFDARHGDVTMVMGPSGSGKSTLVAALSGLLRPDAGEVVALEQNLWKQSDGAPWPRTLDYCTPTSRPAPSTVKTLRWSFDCSAAPPLNTARRSSASRTILAWKAGRTGSFTSKTVASSTTSVARRLERKSMPALFRKPLFWLVVLLAIAVLAIGAVMATKSSQKPAANAATKVVDTPFAAIAAGKVDVDGGVIQVAARTAGVVREVLVQEGDLVKKGDVLARLEDDQLRLAANQAKAAADQARAQIELLQVQKTSASRELKRLEQLKGYAPTQSVDKQRDQVAQADASIAAQKAAVTTAEAQLASTSYQLELTTVRAPADGRIVRRYANPGSGASTLNVSNMFDLEPNTARIVRAELAESDLPNVAVGQEVSIIPDADPLHPAHGTVIRRAYQFGAR